MAKTFYNSAGARQIAALVILLFIPLLIGADTRNNIAGQSGGQPRLGAGRIEHMGSTHQERLDFVQSQIDELTMNLKWLNGKIDKMNADGQYVPDRMHRSVAFKKEKIKLLSELRQNLKKLAEKSPEKKGTKHVKKSFRQGVNPCTEGSVNRRIKETGLADWVAVIRDKKGIRIENRLPILFSSGSAQLVREYHGFIKDLAMVIKDCPKRILVDGYADADPISTARYPSNFELGASRAASVVHALTRYGIHPSEFKVGSTGQYRMAGHRADRWKSLDRHVNISIVLQP